MRKTRLIQTTMKQTYHLSWEIIQEFKLPANHSCCSVDVNEAIGEIVFACRHDGLLHYKWNPNSGLVMATEQPHRVTNYGRNCRLVTCGSDGSHLVLNHRQLNYIRLAANRVQQAQMVHADAGTSTNRTCSLFAPDSLTAYSRTLGMDYIEYLEQAVSVGDVRSMVMDKQVGSVFLLYSDRIVRSSLANLADTCVFDRCYSLNAELFNVCMSRQFVYLMNSLGDISLRYRLECYDKRDQLHWRTIGTRAFSSHTVVERQVDLNRKVCKSSGHYLQLLDSESPVGILGFTVDPCRQIVFASTGGSSLYALWHPDLDPDLSPAGWGKNWLEDIRISLASARGGRVCRGSTAVGLSDTPPGGGDDLDEGGESPGVTTSDQGSESRSIAAFRSFVPGPLASFATTASRSGFLYAVDAISGDKVTVLKYSTETARIG